jgi:hypothetical protein
MVEKMLNDLRTPHTKGFQVFCREAIIILYFGKGFGFFFKGIEVAIEEKYFFRGFADIKNQRYGFSEGFFAQGI